MGGYNSNPPVDSDKPAKTAAEAEAIAGAAVGFRGSYGGPTGQAAQKYEHMRQQQAQAQQQPVVQQQGQPGMKYMGWERDAAAGQQDTSSELARQQAIITTIESRPRYMDASAFGDSTTQAALAAVPEGANKDAELGRILEEQRKKAEMTPGKTDDRFFENQLSLWNAQKIERSSGYHHWAQNTGKQQNANPYENVADIALSWEKAGNVKDNFGKNYAFNPNVNTLLSKLPTDQNGNPMGLQEYDWKGATANYKGTVPPAPVSWMPAIEFINSQHGKYGVYGELYGGVRDTNTPTPSVTANRNAIATPLLPVPSAPGVFFTGSIEAAPKVEVVQPTGAVDVFGHSVVIPGLAFFQQPTIKTTPPVRDETTPFATAFGENFQFRAATDINKLDAAPWVPSKGEVAVGSPVYSEPVTKFNPDTGMTETEYQSTQKYETWDMTKQTVIPGTTSTLGLSGYDVFNKNAREFLHLPSPEVGEQAVRIASLTNPIFAPTTVAAIFTEKFNPEQASNARAMEGLVGLRGQYTTFYEQPALTGISYGVGAVMGTGWRGLEKAGSVLRSVTAEKVISNGGVWRAAEQVTVGAWNLAPKALTAVYGADIALRATNWGTDFTPENVVTKSKGLVIQEGAPMMFGASAGYRLPETAVQAKNTLGKNYADLNWQARYQYHRLVSELGRENPMSGYGYTGVEFSKTQGGFVFGERGVNLENYAMTNEAYIRETVGPSGDMSKLEGIPYMRKNPGIADASPYMTVDAGAVLGVGMGGRKVQVLRPAQTIGQGISRQTKFGEGFASSGQRGYSIRNDEGGFSWDRPSVQVQRNVPISMMGSSLILDSPQISQTVSDTMVISAQKSGQYTQQMSDIVQNQIRRQFNEVSPKISLGQESQQVPVSVSDISSKTDQRTRQDVLSVPLFSQIQVPVQTPVQIPGTNQITKPRIDTGWERTIIPIPPPPVIVPFLPSFPGLGDMGGRPRRPRRNTNLFKMGLDIAGKSVMPRMPKVFVPKTPGTLKPVRRKRR